MWPQKASQITNTFLFHGNSNSQIQRAILRNLNQLHARICWKSTARLSQAVSLCVYSEARAQPHGHLSNSSTTVPTPDPNAWIQHKGSAFSARTYFERSLPNAEQRRLRGLLHLALLHPSGRARRASRGKNEQQRRQEVNLPADFPVIYRAQPGQAAGEHRAQPGGHSTAPGSSPTSSRTPRGAAGGEPLGSAESFKPGKK